jgi:hypothetical protein
MGIFTLVLGLVFLVIALISLKRGRIFAGGRRTRSKITGKAVLYIAIPQAVVAGLAVAVGAADLLGYSAIGQYGTTMGVVLIGTYLVTNLGIGGLIQAKSAIEGVRQPEDG